MHFLGAYCPILVDYFWTISIVLFTNHKVSKFIEFTNIWNNFVCLFAKSELVRGQSTPAFVILFLRTSLCFLNSSHSYSKWSVGPFCKKISWKFSHQVKNANGLWYVATKSIHPFTSDNESHPMEKTVLIKYISHLNQSLYQSIPDDGDSEFPKFNLYRICNFQNSVIQNLQLYHTYTETICPIYIMSPLVVGDEEAFKTMALCTHNKV